MRLQKGLKLSLILLLAGLTGCAQMMGGLRRDLDDGDPYSSPTVGGVWAERGFLSESMGERGRYEDRYSSVGHSERAPASATSGDGVAHGSWVSPEHDTANRRDAYREDMAGSDDVTYSNTPNLEPPVKRVYKNGSRATRADFLDESPNEGSLWASDGQTNYYFSKNKVRSIGDIITVTIEPDLVSNISQEVRRTLSPAERNLELAAAQERIRAKQAGEAAGAEKDQITTSNAAPAREEGTVRSGEVLQVRQATFADIDVSQSLVLKAGETMMAEIVDRYPNGNFKIRGTKKIAFKSGTPRLINLVGVARGNDISEEDVVLSGKLYEYRVEAIR